MFRHPEPSSSIKTKEKSPSQVDTKDMWKRVYAWFDAFLKTENQARKRRQHGPNSGYGHLGRLNKITHFEVNSYHCIKKIFSLIPCISCGYCVLGCLSDKQVPRFTHPTRGAIRVTVKQLSDDELARRLVSGDHDAMAVIFDRYYRLVMSVALRILHDAAEAEDVVQTVFTDFYKKAHLFDAAKGSLRTWLLQYAYGRSFNQKRRLTARGFYEQDEFDEMAAGIPKLCPERVLNLETPDACRLVEQILPSLNDKQRTVIELVFFGGLRLSEVASQTGESLGNVHHAYYRGIEKLRAVLLGTEAEAANQTRGRVRFPWFRRIRQAPQHLGEEV